MKNTVKATRGDREVVRITDARGSLSDDIAGRRRRYLISMTIRVLCFVSAYFAHGALRWIAVAGAVFIPYFAVVIANAGRSLRADAPLPPVAPVARQLSGPAGARGDRDGEQVDGAGAAPGDAGPGQQAQWASHTSGSLVHDRTSSGS